MTDDSIQEGGAQAQCPADRALRRLIEALENYSIHKLPRYVRVEIADGQAMLAARHQEGQQDG